jgi:predicted transposase YbfD/YdcC
MHQEVAQYFDAQASGEIIDARMSFHEDADKGHGRVEKRRCAITPAVEWFPNRGDWPGLRSFCMVESERTIKGKTSTEKRYYISSLDGTDAKLALKASREHWGVENNLHWCLDVTFGDDAANVRLKHLAQNFSVAKRLAMNAVRKMPAYNGNLAQTGRRAAFNSEIRAQLIVSIT